jgi:hypothetical protein
MRRLTLLVVLVAFTFSCGGQWYVLQAIAWTKMIQEYSDMVPFTQAVQMTFSGKYPCELCRIIAEKRQSENAKIAGMEKQEKKILSSARIVIATAPVSPRPRFALFDRALRFRVEAPPTPPPRLA